MPNIPLYIAPDDDKPKIDKPTVPTVSTWSPSEMSAFAHGSPNWVPPITDPSQPAAVVEPDGRSKDDRDLRRMKTLAVGGCVAMVVVALAIGSIVLRTGKAPVPALDVERPTTVVRPNPAVTSAPARPITTVPATTTIARAATTTTVPASTTTTEPTTTEPTTEAAPTESSSA
jgi:eukaryotic-like serine/threonine-protein kinase